ncbi:hypothetical protein FOZ63_015230 [Perkinsus olseni]|uniref:Uncharacterized protein n=1 Tax=Perkinsus olseni TaxID=32597 RepID=A0A7J6UKB9_PEROL|nr:hypothetical protein FOZ63_015230 [Perkinsus olseni]
MDRTRDYPRPPARSSSSGSSCASEIRMRTLSEDSDGEEGRFVSMDEQFEDPDDGSEVSASSSPKSKQVRFADSVDLSDTCEDREERRTKRLWDGYYVKKRPWGAYPSQRVNFTRRMAIHTLGPYNADDIADSPALIFTIIFFILAFVGFSLMALLAPAGSRWRSIILPQLASGVLYVLMWFIFNGSNVFSVLLLTVPAAGPVIAAIYLSVRECVQARKRARVRALTRARAEMGEFDTLWDNYFCLCDVQIDEADTDGGEGEVVDKPPKLRLRSMSTLAPFGEPSAALGNLQRGTTQRFYSIYADTVAPEDDGQPVLNICPVQDCTVTVLEPDSSSEDDVEEDTRLPAGSSPGHGKAMVTPIDDTHGLRIAVCETADKSLAFTVQLHRRRTQRKETDIAHTWWLIVVIIALIIAFAVASFLGFMAPLTSNVLVWVVFGKSGSVYSVLILTLPVLGPVVAAIALWVMDWRRERKRDRMVKKGNFMVEVDGFGDNRRMTLRIGDDADHDGGFLSPCSSSEADVPRSRAISSWTVEGLPDNFQATLDAVRNPRFYSIGRGYSRVDDQDEVENWASEASSAPVHPSISRCEKVSKTTQSPLTLSTIEEGRVYKDEHIPLGDGYSLKVHVGSAPEHKIHFTVHREQS